MSCVCACAGAGVGAGADAVLSDPVLNLKIFKKLA